MVDDTNACNIVHFGSSRCKRVCRSVMAAEVQALILGFDFAFVIRYLINDITGIHMDIEGMTDSRTTFNVVAKETQSTERRLQIDIHSLRESYDTGEMKRMSWIPGVINAADQMTKPILSELSPLYRIMSSNRFEVRPHGWSTHTHDRRFGF